LLVGYKVLEGVILILAALVVIAFAGVLVFKTPMPLGEGLRAANNAKDTQKKAVRLSALIFKIFLINKILFYTGKSYVKTMLFSRGLRVNFCFYFVKQRKKRFHINRLLHIALGAHRARVLFCKYCA